MDLLFLHSDHKVPAVSLGSAVPLSIETRVDFIWVKRQVKTCMRRILLSINLKLEPTTGETRLLWLQEQVPGEIKTPDCAKLIKGQTRARARAALVSLGNGATEGDSLLRALFLPPISPFPSLIGAGRVNPALRGPSPSCSLFFPLPDPSRPLLL